MLISNRDIVELTAFRRMLHRFPELSGAEQQTARRIVSFLQGVTPDQVITELGGHGVAVVFNGSVSGPTIMVRAELDALPIEEINRFDHRSQTQGKGHLCGHDGHMTILCALARMLSRQPPARGRVVLLFQPAEETGQGAARVIADPKFAAIRPDISLSLHNLPGLEIGHVSLVTGPACCASRGLKIRLLGKTAHASMPETGVSPMMALAKLLPKLNELGTGGDLGADYRLATITHAHMGEPVFGVTPGAASIFVTLRAMQDAAMDSLCTQAEGLVKTTAKAEALDLEMSYHDVFKTVSNTPEPAEMLRRACHLESVPMVADPQPVAWSEDFGAFGAVSKSAMFFLGAGTRHPQLHNPDYDFPDALIPIGARIFYRAVLERVSSSP